MDENEKKELLEGEEITEENKPVEDTQAPAEPEVAQPEAPAEPEVPAEPVAPEEPAEEMIPQSRVNELIGQVRKEAREKGRSEALQELVERYGVDDEDGLNAVFGDGQRYSALNEEFGVQNGKLKELQTENVLLKSGVDKDRFDDVIAILEHNHMEVTPESVEQMKLSHPEWTSGSGTSAINAAPEETPAPAPVVRKLGGLPNTSNAKPSLEDDEKSKALKLLGL